MCFEVRPADVDESLRQHEEPMKYVMRLAQEKALAVLSSTPNGSVVLGADTTVVIDGESLGKPVDEEDARRMLNQLSGRSHQVMTGVCVAWRDSKGVVQNDVQVEVTEVEFARMSAEEIAGYIASGEPMDKAGAYGIQGKASRWIPRIRGCYFNVVGLPVARVCSMLRDAGIV
jgi:septum formation protein